MKRSGKQRLFLAAMGGCVLIGTTLAVYAQGGPLPLRQARVPKTVAKGSSPAGSQSPPPSPLWCPPDAVRVGPACVDTYEASVWEIPAANTALITKVQEGTVTLADLSGVAGVAQRGLGGTDDYPCNDSGNDCDDIYAVNIPGVKPSATITWFQAQQACLNAGKRLLSNAEWQRAAAGTPDPGTDNDSTDCNITNDGFPTNDPVNTGSRSSCVSRWGALDMVGNVWEWVADWVPPAATCSSSLFSTGDLNCMTIDPQATFTPIGPAALIRGGFFRNGSVAGVFAVFGGDQPSRAGSHLGFRCVR